MVCDCCWRIFVVVYIINFVLHDMCDLFLNLCLYHTLSYDILPRYHPSLGKIPIIANIFERG